MQLSLSVSGPLGCDFVAAEIKLDVAQFEMCFIIAEIRSAGGMQGVLAAWMWVNQLTNRPAQGRAFGCRA